MFYNISLYQNNNNFKYYNHTSKLAYSNNQLSKKLYFGGLSSKEQYNDTYTYKAACILDQKFDKINKNKYALIGKDTLGKNNIYTKGDLRASKFNQGLNVDLDSFFAAFTKRAIPERIKWGIDYLDNDTKKSIVDAVNNSRAEILKKWHSFLLNPESFASELPKDEFEELSGKIKNNLALNIIIWDAINNNLDVDNRHIPEPLNLFALNKTVREYPKQTSSFAALYSHNLKDEVINKLKQLPTHKDKIFESENGIWVKIPSYKQDKIHFNENVSDLEVLSYKKWCTKSSFDKAKAALLDGEFYIYLEKDLNGFWQPKIGISSYKGKIAQIQGRDNNNIIPIEYLDEVTTFIENRGLQCLSGVSEEGPKAYQQILISQKLKEFNSEIGKTLAQAISDNDTVSIFRYLQPMLKEKKNGALEVNLVPNKGIVVPLSNFGINETKFKNNMLRLMFENEQERYELSAKNSPKNKDSILATFLSLYSKATGKNVRVGKEN